MSWQDWKNTIKETNQIHKNEGFLGKGRIDYNWHPSNYNKETGELNYSEEYKEVFLKLRYHGHIDDYKSYLKVLNRFELRYDKDNDLRRLIAEYISLKNMKWNKSFKKFNWKKLSTYFTCESNDLEKKFIRIENELINIFNRI